MIERDQLRDFYDGHCVCLDNVRCNNWPDFFTEDCACRIIPPANFEVSCAFSTAYAEKPRHVGGSRARRHTNKAVCSPHLSPLFRPALHPRVRGGGCSRAAELLMVQTMIDKRSEMVLSAVCRDIIVPDEGPCGSGNASWRLVRKWSRTA
jgi:hypothetical protein